MSQNILVLPPSLRSTSAVHATGLEAAVLGDEAREVPLADEAAVVGLDLVALGRERLLERHAEQVREDLRVALDHVDVVVVEDDRPTRLAVQHSASHCRPRGAR